MSEEVFEYQSRIEASPGALFAWHRRPGAFERLTPPWERVRVVDRGQGLAEGSRVVLELGSGAFRTRWIARHEDVRENESFVDVQESGPFASWVHEHRMSPDGPGASRLDDRVKYELPLGLPGRLLGGPMVRRKLERVFRYRHRVTREDLAAHQEFEGSRARKIAVSGASGLVGRSLLPFLGTGGHEVRRLVREPSKGGADGIPWDPRSGMLESAPFEGIDAVVHLAGESIADGRWNAAKKSRIRESRVSGTRLLARALSRCERPPEVLVSASAVGFYGSRAGEELSEESPPGEGFLAEVCREWEEATEPARKRGIRVVHLRIGAVLSPAGGALAKMLTPFLLGAGGPIGSGAQYMSWIALDDLLYAILRVIQDPTLKGPVNAVSPAAVTNREFASALGAVLHRPTLLPLPALAARLALGELADELLLASQRVVPSALLRSGFSFRFAELEDALGHLLGREVSSAENGRAPRTRGRDRPPHEPGALDP